MEEDVSLIVLSYDDKDEDFTPCEMITVIRHSISKDKLSKQISENYEKWPKSNRYTVWN